MASLFLAVIPKHSVNVPPLSLGFLQASCKAHGVKVQIRDFNFDLWEETIYSEDSYDIWLETNQTLFKGESFKTFCEEVYNDFIQKWAEEIAATDHTHVGISCFSHRSLPSFKLLASKLRELCPEKIIIVVHLAFFIFAKTLSDVFLNIARPCIDLKGEPASMIKSSNSSNCLPLPFTRLS